MKDDDLGSMPKRVGRPRRYPSDTKNPTLTFRVRGNLYDLLKGSSDENGRSLSEEIERRLDLSFDRGGLFGRPETYQLMLAMAQVIPGFERRFGKPWVEIDDPRFHIAAGRAFQEQIALCQADVDLRPLTAEELARTNEPLPPEPSQGELAAQGGTMVEGEKLFGEDDDLPPDPDARDPSEPNIPLPAPTSTPTRARKQKL